MTNWTNFATGGGARVTTWGYSPTRGFLTSKTDAAGKAVSYTYTPAGRLATRTWARGTNATYGYDTGGQLVSVTYSDSTPGLTNLRDRLGRVTSTVCNGTTTSFTYDLANDVLSESYSGGTLGGLKITNRFDIDLRRTNTTLLNGATTLCQAIYGYDNASRLSTVSDGVNNAAYTYLANSSLVGQIVFSSNTVTRMTTTKQYDFLNRLSSIASTPSNSFAYLYNAANQRTMARLADSSYWHYNYDALGQVIQGDKYWVDQTIVAGQQFNYTFDNIGNRTQTQIGGDQNGANLRLANYTNNNLNQITSRGVPAYVDIMGDGLATNAVIVNGSNAYRKNEYFRQQLGVTNTSAVWDSITVSATNQGSVTGHAYVAQNPENYTYDADGNLLSDGRWNYTWDAENRLLSMTSLSGAPSGSQLQLNFTYDYQGRRIQKQVSTNNGSSYIGEYTNKYAYDGWNCVATMNPSFTLSNSFLWGSDLSGSLQGAGGVGGLIKVAYYGITTTNCFVSYDGNGNVGALISAASGATVANYEYGPFGELIRCSGPMAKLNPMRFSTKFDDDESDFLYCDYRYYTPSTGRWLSRDPKDDSGFAQLISVAAGGRAGNNLYLFVNNNPTGQIDPFGLWSTDVHHQIVEDWLTDPKYKKYPCGCCTIDVISLIQDGSDEVDGVGPFVIWYPPTVGFGDAQSSKYAYRHAMRAPTETVAQAQAEYNDFVQQQLEFARGYAQKGDCFSIKQALRYLGKAYHSISDSYSPSHEGFQIWWDSHNGPPEFNGYLGWFFVFVMEHHYLEDMSAYNRPNNTVPQKVASQLQSELDHILSQCNSKQ